MWICSKGHKNSNSNKSCHGINCEEQKPKTNKKTITVDYGLKIRDYCPNCKEHMTFTRTNKKKNRWTCTRCKRKTKLVGKPVPEPTILEA